MGGTSCRAWTFSTGDDGVDVDIFFLHVLGELRAVCVSTWGGETLVSYVAESRDTFISRGLAFLFSPRGGSFFERRFLLGGDALKSISFYHVGIEFL